MTIEIFDKFLLGMIVMCCLIIGLYFVRFYRKSRDRLFLFFATAFWLLGANWFVLVFYNGEEPGHAHLYILRLVAFVILLIGIWDKNRARA